MDDGKFEPQSFGTFGPKALAGIGKLWETVADRRLPIRLQRRLADEPILPFRADGAARNPGSAKPSSMGKFVSRSAVEIIPADRNLSDRNTSVMGTEYSNRLLCTRKFNIFLPQMG
ncbi:MAG: hypothetical protein ACRD1C_08610 [Terriglobales bacterium]